MKPVGSKPIKTERLLLRAIKEEDAEALIRIGSLAMSIAEAKRNVAYMINEASKPFNYHWVITHNGLVIGRIKAWDVNPYNGYLQLGYDIGAEFRNKGCMTEAVKAVIDYLMTKAEVNRIFCSVRMGNEASRRVCEKCGMIYEGTLRQHYARQDGSFDDVCIYGIIRRDTRKG